MVNFNNIKPGTRVHIVNAHGQSRYVNSYDMKATFLGFSNMEKPHSSTPTFNTLKEVKHHYNVKTNSDLEELPNKRGYDYGQKVYAVFLADDYSKPARNSNNTQDGNVTTYLYEGKWAINSGADLVRLIEE